MITTSLIATIDTPRPIPGAAGLPAGVDSIELRADLVGDMPDAGLRSGFHGSLIYALRSVPEGGRFAGDARERLARLAAAAETYDLVELEGERDLVPEILDAVPPSKRIISWHGPADGLAALEARLDRYLEVGATLYRLVPAARTGLEAIQPLRLLAARRRSDVIAYASGPYGGWTRVIAPYFGAPVVFAPLAESELDAGAFGIARLIEDYGLPTLRPVRRIFGIIGTSVAHSLSPRLHNAGYREHGHPSLFFPFYSDDLAEFRRSMEGPEGLATLGIAFGGGTIAAPHKQLAVELARTSSSLCRTCEAANNIVSAAGAWIAGTTDSVGVHEPLLRRGISPAGRRALVVGCGGAGRTIAASLKLSGAEVTLMNRGVERGLYASRLLDLPLLPLDQELIRDFDIVVNATSVGRDPGQSAFSVRLLPADAVVVDLIYGSRATRLVEEARGRGMPCIDGREVLRAQVLAQFRMLTGTSLSRAVADGVLGREEHADPIMLAAPGS